MPFIFAGALTPVELPEVRKRLCGSRAKKTMPCLKAPALLRLAVLWVLQVWWIILWRGAESVQAAGAEVSSDDAFDQLDNVAEGDSAAWSPATISVVLPCAGEGEYAFKTVKSVFDSTPEGVLLEIIVVDDGTSPPLTDSHLSESVRQQYKVKVIRHEETVGLIGAKQDGGDAATGDIVVFFDCHVAPQEGWYDSFLKLVGQNYRRIVVPVITDLDVTTWTQRGGSNGMAKCYLTWDADFKWLESDDPYIPVLSGGLLGMSKRWWNETGGYDKEMKGWGGENIDQSLRSWLCGGEIMMAKDSHVAHMWRVPSDPRTSRRYNVAPGAPGKNRMRAAVAWFDEFAEKLDQFPDLAGPGTKSRDGGLPWYGDISNIRDIKERLHCKSFAWFMKRFKHVYEDGGLVPRVTYGLKVRGIADTVMQEHPNGMCLTYAGRAGTSGDGRGTAELRPCDAADDRQRWHGANRDLSTSDKSCCSGLRAWNTDQCIAGPATQGKLHTFVCDIAGRNHQQAWRMTDDGRLEQSSGKAFMSSNCVVEDSGQLVMQACPSTPVWSKFEPTEPIEARLYWPQRDSVDLGTV